MTLKSLDEYIVWAKLRPGGDGVWLRSGDASGYHWTPDRKLAMRLDKEMAEAVLKFGKHQGWADAGMINRRYAETVTEQVIQKMANYNNGWTTPHLAHHTLLPMADIRKELKACEKLGIVYRTGQTRATRWWLG